MPNWNGIILTNKGRVLQAKVEAGETLNLTKLKLGSGIISEGQSLEALTDLIRPEQNLGIAAKTAMENGFTKIEATITNAGLEEGYYVRELGVFAQDPDDGEILYDVTTDTAPDYLPAQGGAAVLSQEFAVYITTSNVDHIEATIDPTALATVGFVNLAINTHNTDANAHANLALLINDALAPTADNNTLVNLLSNLANMLTKVTGQSDWKTGPAASIAAILSNLQGNLAVNWDSNKFTVPALGVSGLMAQNGYVNFGKLVGGLIVQWGFSTSTATGVHVDFPIKFQTVLYGIQESHRADLRDDQKTAVIAGADLTGFGLYNSGTTGYGFNWLAIGR